MNDPLKLEHTDHCIDSSSGTCRCHVGGIEDMFEEVHDLRIKIGDLKSENARLQERVRELERSIDKIQIPDTFKLSDEAMKGLKEPGILKTLSEETRMSDPIDIDLWEEEAAGFHICESDKFAARNTLLIQEVRRLQEQNRVMREALKVYARIAPTEFNGHKSYNVQWDYGTIARTALVAVREMEEKG